MQVHVTTRHDETGWHADCAWPPSITAIDNDRTELVEQVREMLSVQFGRKFVVQSDDGATSATFTEAPRK